MVTVTLPERQFAASATTDVEGRYSFAQLPAGGYVLRASKAGFVSQSYGATKPRESAVPIVVGTRRTATADLTLDRGGAIEGRIVNGAGDPVQDVAVQAVRVGYDSAGRRMIPTGARSRTDDLGHFRIHSLPAGRYFIEASAAGLLPVASDDVMERSQRIRPFARTFHPGTTSLNEADPVAVAAGRTVSLSFSISNVPVVRWTGQVEDSQGRMPDRMSAVLRFRGGPPLASMALDGKANQFGFNPLPSGDYVLGIVLRTKDARPEFAIKHLSIGGHDVTEPVIRTAPGVTLRGRIEIESAPSILPPSGLGIVAISTLFPGVVSDPNGRRFPARVAPDGAFTLEHLFGPRLFRIEAGPTWAIKGVFLGDDDITDTSVDFSVKTEPKPLRMVLTNRTGSVSGTVAADRGGTALGQVVVFSDAEERWGVESRFTKVADVRADRFEVRGLLPGRYLVAHAADLEPGAWSDAEVLRDLKQSAVAAQVVEGADTPVTLKRAGNE
jgi:hypothetical protein